MGSWGTAAVAVFHIFRRFLAFAMENFTYFNPTRIHFGRGQIAAIDRELPAQCRVLLLAGGGSIRANGVHDQVRRALGSRAVLEFFGVEANPDYDTHMRAVELARREKTEWILAAGGGSRAMRRTSGLKLVLVRKSPVKKNDPLPLCLPNSLRITSPPSANPCPVNTIANRLANVGPRMIPPSRNSMLPRSHRS